MSILISPAEFARRHDLHKTTISRLCRRGFFDSAIIRVPGKKRYFLDQTKADLLLAENRDPNFCKDSEINTKHLISSKQGKHDDTFISARTMSERYRAADLKLKYEIKQGKWVTKAQVRDESFKAGRIFRDTILNIGPRVAAILAAETDEYKILRILHEEHEQALKECVRMMKLITVKKSEAG